MVKVDSSLKSVLNAKHKIESMVESSTDGSTDTTEKDFQELCKITDQVTLSAIKATEKWGKEVLHNAKEKEYVEEITL